MLSNKKEEEGIKMLYGAIEAGGTKFVCAVGNKENEIIDKIIIKTMTPKETMPQVIHFFKKYNLASMGIGCFGPININECSKTYGYILATPKIAWQHYNFLGELRQHFSFPIAWETDVNVAAYGELLLGAAKGKRSCLYVTIGTGVGGGYVTQDGFIPTLLHGEMGHIHLKRLENDNFVGNCPFHRDCVEGMLSGPALEKRFGKRGEEIPNNDSNWDIIAYYIAQALYTYTMILSPEQIVLGGGVMQRGHLYPLIHKYFETMNAGYIDFTQLGEQVDKYIVAPALAEHSAIVGAIELAKTLTINE